jgi:hypothetical protein
MKAKTKVKAGAKNVGVVNVLCNGQLSGDIAPLPG